VKKPFIAIANYFDAHLSWYQMKYGWVLLAKKVPYTCLETL